MQLRLVSDACPIRKKFVTLPTMENVFPSPPRNYEAENNTDNRGDPPFHCSPPGWICWCNPLILIYYGKEYELGIRPTPSAP